MFYLHTVQCNIKRNTAKSLITVGICIFVLLLLNLYLKSIRSNEEQLTELASVSSIYCRITNLEGSLETGLEISEELMDKLLAGRQVKDVSFSIRMVAGEGDFPIEDWQDKLNLFIAGANKLEAVPGLSPENVHLPEETVTDFFSSAEAMCLVSETTMEKYGWESGDKVVLNLYYQYYDDRKMLHWEPLELLPAEILGTMEHIVSRTEQIPPDILFPLATLRESFRRNGIPFRPESGFFYVADPLELNAFKEEMKSFGLLEKIPAADFNYQGNALAVRDSTFRTLASQLRQSIDTLWGFFPLIGITIVLIGYIASFLLINSRKNEFAIMRMLGAGKGTCFGLFLTEQLVLMLAGEIIGGSAALLLFRGGMAVAAAGVIFLLSYLAGCMVALWRIGSAKGAKEL